MVRVRGGGVLLGCGVCSDRVLAQDQGVAPQSSIRDSSGLGLGDT